MFVGEVLQSTKLRQLLLLTDAYSASETEPHVQNCFKICQKFNTSYPAYQNYIIIKKKIHRAVVEI